MKVTIPDFGKEKLKRWAKAVERVDTSKDNGYCFEGRFLRAGEKYDLPDGTVILSYGLEFTNSKQPSILLNRVESDGTLTLLYERHSLPLRWAIEIRDEVKSFLENSSPAPANVANIPKQSQDDPTSAIGFALQAMLALEDDSQRQAVVNTLIKLGLF